MIGFNKNASNSIPKPALFEKPRREDMVFSRKEEVSLSRAHTLSPLPIGGLLRVSSDPGPGQDRPVRAAGITHAPQSANLPFCRFRGIPERLFQRGDSSARTLNMAASVGIFSLISSKLSVDAFLVWTFLTVIFLDRQMPST